MKGLNYDKAKELLKNSNVRTYLDMIAKAEGAKHGYHTMFGGRKAESLTAHPNVKVNFTQTDGKRNSSGAAGRYQFLKSTWDPIAKKYNFKDFGPENQDIAAIELLNQNGALEHILKGEWDEAVNKSGRTWASLPSSKYKQNKRSWEFVKDALGEKKFSGGLELFTKAIQSPGEVFRSAMENLSKVTEGFRDIAVKTVGEAAAAENSPSGTPIDFDFTTPLYDYQQDKIPSPQLNPPQFEASNEGGNNLLGFLDLNTPPVPPASKSWQETLAGDIMAEGLEDANRQNALEKMFGTGRAMAPTSSLPPKTVQYIDSIIEKVLNG